MLAYVGFGLVQVGPSWLQVSPKVAPSWSHVGLCWAKLAPSWPQVAPKFAHVGPSWPKLAQVGPKLVPIWAQVVSCWLMLPLAPLPPERISQAMLSKMSTKALPLRRCWERSSNKQMPFKVFDERLSNKDVPSSWRFQNKRASLEFLDVLSKCFLLVVLSW